MKTGSCESDKKKTLGFSLVGGITNKVNDYQLFNIYITIAWNFLLILSPNPELSGRDIWCGQDQ
jgi:hypothetical protein